MKKQLYKKLIAFAPLSLVALLGLTSCNNASSGNEKVVLRVLNAADYIYESGDISEEELEKEKLSNSPFKDLDKLIGKER